MKRLLFAAAAVTLSSSFAVADSLSATSAILALRGNSAPRTTTLITGLQNWRFGSVAFSILLLRQGQNIKSTTTIIHDNPNSRVSVTDVVIQNSSASGGFHY